MAEKSLGEATVSQCPAGHGVFLPQAENDWHRNAGQHTAPLPRITADMTAPPTTGKVSRAWIETLFS